MSDSEIPETWDAVAIREGDGAHLVVTYVGEDGERFDVWYEMYGASAEGAPAPEVTVEEAIQARVDEWLGEVVGGDGDD